MKSIAARLSLEGELRKPKQQGVSLQACYLHWRRGGDEFFFLWGLWNPPNKGMCFRHPLRF